MTEETLEALKSAHAELGVRIAAYEAKLPCILNIDAVAIELRAGEHYAGAVLNNDGTVRHHLVMLAEKPSERLGWREATAWAEQVGGVLPTRQEAALIFANCKPHVEPDWHWTSEEHTNASYAWLCYFGCGNQSTNDKSYAGCARAVRRVEI